MTLAFEEAALGIGRHFTAEGVNPFDMVEWETSDARITNWSDGTDAFYQPDVEFPSSWSVNARNIVAQKYFRGELGSASREASLKTVVDRIVSTIAAWGLAGGYFVDQDEADVFADELRFILVTQRAAFNSPVWFNIGVKGVPQQASACFILSVEDSMPSILEWYRQEGVIFKGGSGAGINLSTLRSADEQLDGGGTASGPVSFMRGADASAGTIKSGGKTRRAAKMVILNADHPDVEDFVWCKAREERKSRVLAANGFDMSLNGADAFSVQYQNANNSVRVTDDFMQAVLDDAQWSLKAVTTGEVIKTVRARELMHEIASAAWECADPGMQFDTTINRWNTSANTASINASNPCSEYMHLDNSACNLASINLVKYQTAEGDFDVDAFVHTVRILTTAQDILVDNAAYPTPQIEATTRAFRQLGLGYANLGALLMSEGMPYDSEVGRAWAAAITALMTGGAYRTSVDIAAKLGPHRGYRDNVEPMQRVLRQHRDAVEGIDATLVPEALISSARSVWREVCDQAAVHGVRNAQASVLAPTGTIGLAMDCDTTGIEPDLGLFKTKKLVGGGTLQIVNQSVGRALEALGYQEPDIERIVAYLETERTIVGAPGLDPDHLAVFACAMGDNVILHMGHVRMMAAVQPFLSGAISKTVNMPEDVTVDDVEELFIESWKAGIKAVAIYRDGSKYAQPLETNKKSSSDVSTVALSSATQLSSAAVELIADARPVREKLPRSRQSKTFSFRVADCHGYVTVGEYPDGRPGEIFLRVAKQGSTLAGIMDAFAISVSHGLQYGVPLRSFVEAFVNMRFEPAGITDDPDLRLASSLVDYIFRRLALEYLPTDERQGLGILTVNERKQPTLPGVDEATAPSLPVAELSDPPSAALPAVQLEAGGTVHAEICPNCGDIMRRAGSCYACPSCGSTSGCS
ncbi:MAG: vitamin B12-dependent ribonucleotide reductase [Acidimicrobiia bacterium]|nr:vitamin B12-dependent ribonucleotide reductase [Acidimicrobiia bacterium]